MHCRNLFHSNRVDAVHATDNRVWVFLQVQLVVRQNLQKELQLIVCHSLNYELSVVAKEEETSAGTRTLSSLKNHISVELGAEARKNNI